MVIHPGDGRTQGCLTVYFGVVGKLNHVLQIKYFYFWKLIIGPINLAPPHRRCGCCGALKPALSMRPNTESLKKVTAISKHYMYRCN